MNLVEAPLAIVDLETTGTRPGADRVTEIGVLEIERFEVVSEWSTLVNPGIVVRSEIPRVWPCHGDAGGCTWAWNAPRPPGGGSQRGGPARQDAPGGKQGLSGTRRPFPFFRARAARRSTSAKAARCARACCSISI